MEYLGLRQTNYGDLADFSWLSELAVYEDFKDLEYLNVDSADFQLENSNKGALIIRMMEWILNEDRLKAAARLFLKHMWGQNNKTDYFDLREKVVGSYTWADIAKTLVGLIKNKEVPLVRVSIANATHIALKQEVFGRAEDHEDGNLWLLPVTYKQHGENFSSRKLAWLTPHEHTTFIERNTDEIILIDPLATGFHRTIYDPILLHRIQNWKEVDNFRMETLTRAKLINDYFIFAEQGKQ